MAVDVLTVLLELGDVRPHFCFPIPAALRTMPTLVALCESAGISPRGLPGMSAQRPVDDRIPSRSTAGLHRLRAFSVSFCAGPCWTAQERRAQSAPLVSSLQQRLAYTDVGDSRWDASRRLSALRG